MVNHRWCSKLVVVATALLMACGPVWQASAYQTFGIRVGDRVVPVKWSRLPVRYSVTDQNASGVSASQFRNAVARALASWQAVPTADVSTQFVGFTSAVPGDDDGQNTLGFAHRPDLERVLGMTTYLVDEVTGEIVESDIMFNTAFPWSVAEAGETGRYDVESIVLHETGHIFGLGHSGLGETELREGGGRRVLATESVMFPIALSAGTIAGRTLRADDIAGLSTLYPRAGAISETGSLSGRVLKNGVGVFGAHVVAFNPRTGTLVGNVTVDANGNFAIGGLQPGPHVIRVEPIDDAALESYFDDDQIPRVDTDFRVAFADRLVVVPKGGGAPPIDITVLAK